MNPLTETWQIHNRINLYLLETIDEGKPRTNPASRPDCGATICAHTRVAFDVVKGHCPALLEACPSEKENITKLGFNPKH